MLRDFLAFNNFKSIRHRLGLDADAPAEAAAQVVEALPFGPYGLVTALDEVVAQARAAGMVALSVQTDDPASLHGNLVGIGFCTAAGKAAYLPLAHNLGSRMRGR